MIPRDKYLKRSNYYERIVFFLFFVIIIIITMIRIIYTQSCKVFE